MQYQKHPIDVAIESIAPIFAPSFTVRSSRDAETVVLKYPLIDYAIGGIQGVVFDTSKNLWRTSYFVVLDFLLQERKPLDWCIFTELQAAKDRHALFYDLDKIFTSFMELLTKPSKLSNLLNASDMIYAQHDFKLENVIATNYHYGHGGDKLTGISTQFVLSAVSDTCCAIDTTNLDQLTKLQALTIVGSVSWNKIQAVINSL